MDPLYDQLQLFKNKRTRSAALLNTCAFDLLTQSLASAYMDLLDYANNINKSYCSTLKFTIRLA